MKKTKSTIWITKQTLLVAMFCLMLLQQAGATNYYINCEKGSDDNKATHPNTAWKTMSPVKNIQLKAGDSILFASGQSFTGMLQLVNVHGNAQRPVVISSYVYEGNKRKPVLDAGSQLNTILVQNSSYIKIKGLEITAQIPYQNTDPTARNLMRCGILVELTQNDWFNNIELDNLLVHDVYFNEKGFKRSAEEVRSANGTQSYGWGIRFINNTPTGKLTNIKVSNSEIYNVSHTGLKMTANRGGVQDVEIAHCKVHDTGGPGMQFSGIQQGHIHDNKIDHSGSRSDSRNWGRGSGLWTWGCSNILIEHNRFENANGPGDSAGVHIDFNCNDVVVQYNFSANNAGGFCEILGNDYNCAYRYNVSVNDGFRVKGVDGAFQEGKIFWLSGYVGDQKKPSGPFNSYFYNNTIYVSANITPRIAVSSSTKGVLIANNIFYFEAPAKMVAGDQKKKEIEADTIGNIVFKNNLYLRPDNWPTELALQDAAPIIGDPGFTNKGSVQLSDYMPTNKKLVLRKGIKIDRLPNDSIGLRMGLKMEKDILGNPVPAQPGLGAIEVGNK